MASCNSIICLALSKLGIAGATRPPRQEDLNLGLTTLQSLFRSMIAGGTLGRGRSVVVSSDYTARENDRILRMPGATGSIELPLTVPMFQMPTVVGGQCAPDYGLIGGSACQRAPRNGAFVVINDAETGNSAEMIYDGYRNAWITIGDLSLDDGVETRDAGGSLLRITTSDAPLSSDATGLAALLALSLADHFGATVQPSTARDAQRYQMALIQGMGEEETIGATGTYW